MQSNKDLPCQLPENEVPKQARDQVFKGSVMTNDLQLQPFEMHFGSRNQPI